MIKWITRTLGTCPFEKVDDSGVDVVDVRHLVDKGGNSERAVQSAIAEGLTLLAEGKRVVVCCDYGMSRSNAIAAGILAVHNGIRFSDAVRKVIESTGEQAIRLDVLGAVENALATLAPENQPVTIPDYESVLITGASGFIGKALVSALSPRCRITAPGSAELDLTIGQAQLSLLARENRISQIVHLANPRIFSTNAALGPAVVSLKNVIDVCRQSGIRLVFMSGWEIYSAYQTQLLYASESLPPNPKGPYGLAKYLCERMLEQEHRNDADFDYSIVRSAPVYGAGSDRPKFIYRFIDLALRGEEIVTHRYRNGLPVLELTHISDAVAALAAVVERRAPGEFNIGGGLGISTAAAAQMIVEFLGSKSAIRQNDISEFCANIMMDSTRARSILGWKPVADLTAELQQLVSTRRHGKAVMANRN